MVLAQPFGAITGPNPTTSILVSSSFYLPSPLLPRAALESLLTAALDAAASPRQLREAHGRIVRLGLHRSNFLVARLLRRLADQRVSTHPYPLLVFAQVPRPNSFLWTALIRGAALLLYSASSSAAHPLRLYAAMRRSWPPAPPLPFTFSALLKACGAARCLPMGTQVHAQALATGGFDSDLFVQNTLISFYVECSDLSSARKLFDRMSVRDAISWTSLIVAYTKTGDMGSAEGLFEKTPVKDMVAWTAMVTGYAQNSMPKEALETFDRMREAGVKIDEVSLIGAISGCAQLGAVKHAGFVREIAERYEFKRNVVMGSAMVDMYAKCGLVDEARKVFDGMVERNVYTYSAMIVGLAAHGRAQEAIALFKEMVERTEVKPNRVTFIGVLTACSHAGMVEEGRSYFAQMKDEYGISPSADHYACMVDLLGRSGLVEEALELVKSMPVEPHGGVWGALLGACRIHGKTQIAKIAADHLFVLEPDGIGNYVLLSNIYASAGMWEEVSKVRKLMRGRGLRKNPAASWVEAKDGLVHEFFAGDGLHPRSREIKEALEELLRRLKQDGYVPVLSSVVYDVSDDEKERLLKGHSEKLALAFGLLTTTVGGTIRIVKNLRICEDCHLVMRLVSKVESREIVVRDNMRFHHFKNGECSCGEFW
ncbi:pentatricopeptide repeat-containing protein At5g44230 [Phoenix dactylifera]|uniref:Pentatricopeptide repeat-containing protein At5g44230 n=1 Tax=Phoenix dactylifera TaxID=42345 RepID=A0A8B7CRM2_PHODC|nr:pentatricopeptide repeat-containing protein At5g44230 [Phoenix dactylifera]